MKVASVFFKGLHWPLCRAYARHVLGDRPADRLFQALCAPQFHRIHGYRPRFRQPRRFAEKLWARMLLDRNPEWTLLCDKLRVRSVVESRIGAERLVPLLWHGNNPREIPFDKFPEKFVLKANHGCGYNLLVTNRRDFDPEAARRTAARWLAENFCSDRYLGAHWGYKNIVPEILVEVFLDDAGSPPVDFKFYCFGGRVEFITLHFDRFSGHQTAALDREFRPLQCSSRLTLDRIEDERPSNFAELVETAEALARGYDFMRVDLYNVEGKIYFGEYTPYPGGVSSIRAFDLRTMDVELGEKWESASARLKSGSTPLAHAESTR